MAGHLESEWQSLSAKWLPVNASKRQRMEMRQAFYAGAAVAINRIIEAASLSDAEGDRIALELHAELGTFCTSLSAEG